MKMQWKTLDIGPRQERFEFVLSSGLWLALLSCQQYFVQLDSALLRT